MLQTSARLLRLLSLLQSRRFWSGSELAERLEVTERTVRRDVDRLRSLGYPVDAASGIAGGYQLGAGATLPPLLLDDDEAIAIAIALRTAAGGSVAGLDEAAVRALAKLERVLPSRLRRRVGALQASIFPLLRGGPSVEPEVLSSIAGACLDHLRLCFDYADMRGVRTERVVEPQGLVHTGDRWYLVAWDTARTDWRTFRVDRIVGELATQARFDSRPPPEGGDLRAFVSRSVSSAPYPVQVEVILHGTLEDLAQRVPPTVGRLEKLDGDRCRLETGAASLDGLAVWIGMLGVEFEVCEPPELLDQLRAVQARIARAVERPKRRRARSPRTKAGAKTSRTRH